MTDPRPFVIKTFVAEGLPDGLRLVEKSNWIGLGVVCPRGRYPTAKKRKEFLRSGVYILVGQQGNDLPSIYIGEAERVRERIDQHYVNRDFWQQAIIFTTTGHPLNKAEVKYIEARLVELAAAHRRCRLENGNTPQRPRLAEPDQAVMDGYLAEMLSLLPVLGIDAFERPETNSHGQHIYYLKGIGCDATGWETNTGFLVRKGSLARGKATDSMKKHVPAYYKMRNQLIDDGILINEADPKDGERFRFGEDHVFNSPSQAASICKAVNTNGLTAWKDGAGASIKENREQEAGV